MDAATMGAVLAALLTQRTMKNSVSEALALAAETLEPSDLDAETLATALKQSIWAGTSKDQAYALARAGDRIILFYDKRKEYHAALRMNLESKPSYDGPCRRGSRKQNTQIEQIRNLAEA